MYIIKKIDDIGRIAIPKDLRRSLRWLGGDEIEIIPKDDGSIILRKHTQDSLPGLYNLREEWIDNKEIYQQFSDLIDLIEQTNK